MQARFLIISIACLPLCAMSASAGVLTFDRQKIGDTNYEACSAFDVNNDGNTDLVSGGCWYKGPAFTEKVKICDVPYQSEYYDDFSDYPMDVNGDGFTDIVTGGWFNKTLSWRENPKGQQVEWTTHKIDEVGNVERGCYWDVNGDGSMDAAPNLPGGPFVVFELERDAAGKGTAVFKRHDLSPTAKQGHGLGFGDVNGDGRGDFVSASGWLEAPADLFGAEWTWHAEFEFGGASVPIEVFDMNQDGKNDLIVGQGHDYGLAWYEQAVDGAGARSWKKHDIETNISHFHDMMLVDLDNDGARELLTGKRWRAHNGHDPGDNEFVGVYAYSLSPQKIEKQVLDFGPAGEHSGTGLFMWAEDVDKNGWVDILAPGKEGLFLFLNRGISRN